MSKNKTSSKASKKTTTKKSATKKVTVAKKTTTSKAAVSTASTAKKQNLLCTLSSCISKKVIIITIIILAIFLGSKIFNSKNSSVSTVGDVEAVVANWIENNPELILESVINMQKKQAQQKQQDSTKSISSKMDDLYKRDQDPSIAPAGYDIAIIEFFDYNCGYCKRAYPTIEKLAKDDIKVKIIFKELPILGKSSEDLAKVSLAFNMLAPSRYVKFHADLMRGKARTTADAINIAIANGVTAAKINTVLTKFKSKIDAEIKFNRDLASSIGVNGTPAFLIGETLLPGAVDINTLKAEINKQRGK